MPRRITPQSLRAAAFACALAAPIYSSAHAAPKAGTPKVGTVITSAADPISVRTLNMRAAGRVGAGFGAHSISNRLNAANNLALPLSSASLASVISGRTVLAQNAPNAPAAAPREEPRLEIPVGPANNDPQPAPAPLPAEAPAEAPANNGAAPATPAEGTVVTPPAAPTPDDIARADAEGRPIKNVRVVGNRVVTESSILLQATTQAGAAYSSRQIELDRAKIDALGFFASVQSQVTPNIEDTTRVDVTFIVVENRVVSGFKFEGSSSVSEGDLLKVLVSKTGNVLDRNKVNQDLDAIQTLYRERGFAGLVTESRQLEDGTVVYVIQEGTVSKVVFSGLKKTSEALLRRQIRTKSGDAFDQSRLRLDLNRIYDTGFFDDVSYRVSDDADKPGSIIITIQVKEKRTGQLSLGVGFDNRSKITGFASVGETNFRGTGTRVNASVELGSRRTFELGYGNPFVGTKNASYDFALFSRVIYREPRSIASVAGVPANTTSFNFEEKRVGGRFNLTLPQDVDRNVNFLVGLRAEQASLYQTDVSGVIIPVNLPVNTSGRIVAPSIGFLRDKRDLRTEPSRGGREQITIEKGLSILGGSANFTKIDIDVRRYFPIIGSPKPDELPKLVFAARAVVGRSLGQLPAFEQYFIGGSDTVRGYDVDELYGDNQAYTNVELRFRLQRKFQIVGFIDAGTASGGQFSSTNSGVLFSVGAGVRVQTPIGPLRLDIGRGRDGIRTHFGLGPTF